MLELRVADGDGPVGFRSTRGSTVLTLPSVYRDRIDALSRDLRLSLRGFGLLLRVAEKYLDRSARIAADGLTVASVISDGSSPGRLLDSLQAAIGLLSEYYEHGLYVEKEVQISVSGPGQIDWMRTLGSRGLVVAESGVVLAGYAHRVRRPGSKNPLRLLQSSALGRIHNLLGLPLPADIEGSDGVPAIDGLRIARACRDRVFRDRGREVVALLEGFFGGELAREQRAAASIGWELSGMEYVWEDIIRTLFQSLTTADNQPQRGQWIPEVTAEATGGIAPRVDSVRDLHKRSGESVRVVIDAKWKKIAPFGWSGTEQDHYKQAMYSAVYASTLRMPSVGLLVFPDVTTLPGTQLPVRILGRHRWASVQTSEVWEVALDYEWAAAQYTQHQQSSTQLEELLDAIVG